MSVPSRPVEFDHNSAEHTAAGPLEIYRNLRESCPVAWTEASGGYWVVSSYGATVQALTNPDIYASGASVDANGEPHGGIFIPSARGMVAMIPTEVDPPIWEEYRRLLSPRFSPAAVKSLRPMMKELTTRHVDLVIQKGECDLALDIAGAIPASAILARMGIDTDEWMFYAEPFHNILGFPPGSAEYERAMLGLQDIVERIRVLIQQRRQSPGDDLVSLVAGAVIGGKPIDDESATGVVYTLFSGGVDTTTTLLANAFAYLSRNPDAKQALIADRSLIPLATEEFMRFATPVQALARTVQRQTQLGGQTLEEGDRVLLAFASANRDESAFPDPDTCQLGRYPNKHLSWGMGLHRCLGSHFARATIETILEEVLDRMPDFTIDEERSFQYPNIGIVNGWAQLIASFSPGPRSDQSPADLES